MAVMNASRGVTRPSRPHSEAMVSSAFKMFSVAVSSVLRIWKNRRFNTSEIIKKMLRFLDRYSFLLIFLLAWHLKARTKQLTGHTSRHWPSPPILHGLLLRKHKLSELVGTFFSFTLMCLISRPGGGCHSSSGWTSLNSAAASSSKASSLSIIVVMPRTRSRRALKATDMA